VIGTTPAGDAAHGVGKPKGVAGVALCVCAERADWGAV
jgi:hypothetical protein